MCVRSPEERKKNTADKKNWSTRRPGLPDFSWSKDAKTGKIYQMTTNCAELTYSVSKWQ
jgi:hypothetical protein